MRLSVVESRRDVTVTDNQPSPGYGATGTSPPLDDNGVQFPPPLDLGEPGIPPSPDLKSQPPAYLEPSDINRERLKGRVDSARGSGFSPNVKSIPETPPVDGQDEGRGTSSEGGPSSPDTPTTPLTHSGKKHGHGHGHTKGSPSKFSFKSPKTHASVGVSPGSVADAPSGRKSLREFLDRLRCR